MDFYVQPLGVHAENALLEIMSSRDLPFIRHYIKFAGTYDINDAYRLTPEALFVFVHSSYGQACNAYVKNEDGSFRSFPAYQLARCHSLPPPDVLAAIRCRPAPELEYE